MLTRSLAIMAKESTATEEDNTDSRNASPKDGCGSCAARFYAKQQFLQCLSCERRFHCKCINVRTEDYNFFMESGQSSYKCSSCARRSSVSPSVDNGTEFHSSKVHPTSNSADIRKLSTLDHISELSTILNRLDLLETEVKCLKAENSHLRSELLQLRGNFPPLPPPASRRLSEVVAAGRMTASCLHPSNVDSAGASNRISQHNVNKHRQAPPSKNASVDSDRPDVVIDGANGCSSSDFASGCGGGTSPMDITEDGFKVVKYRRRETASSGTLKLSMVKAVPRKPISKTLFVARLDPRTSIEDVKDLLKPVLGDKTVQCVKLRTKYDSYASFHLSGDDEAFAALNSPDVWPEGSIFHQFFVKLDESRVVEAQNDSHGH
ncbi:hypothetical protein HPB48_013484 [Haemaphysalis longicornis]|uniref:Zinc finger PHD-type domain-containing protein n=1 Tax=Haemaphysalis longicornis TaxID=44386 RepID=A0A9J6FXX8_HAELO|nr:hypothetical protein HPB48_013484 [Haemaphysalis longicornis]